MLGLAAAGSAAAALGACVQQPAGQSPPTATAAVGTSSPAAGPFEVVVALAAEPSTLDQHQRLGGTDGIVASQVFDSLLLQGHDGTIGPGLAETYEFASDGMSVTLKLRQNVRFHDGTPFNAEAVRFSLHRQLDSTHESYADGTWRLVGLFLGNVALPVAAVDERTVKITFKARVANDINLQALAGPAANIVSPTAVRSLRKDFGSKPVGTGPFAFVSWDKGQRLVFRKNDEYWGRKPAIDRLIMVPITDHDARLAALRSGNVDINSDVQGSQLRSIRGASGFAVASRVAWHTWLVLFNRKVVPQLSDKRVRQALNYAVDKQSIVRETLSGSGTVAAGPVSPAFGPYHHDGLKGFAYDPALAKQLLTDAGFAGGAGIPPLTMLVPTNPALGGDTVAISEIIQANLAAVGVRLNIKPVEFAVWRTEAPKGEFQLTAFSQNSALGDPDNVLFQCYHSSRWPPQHINYGWYKNDEFESISAASRSILDRATRAQNIRRQQEIVGFEDPAAIWIEHGHFNAAFNTTKIRSMEVATQAQALPFNLVERR